MKSGLGARMKERRKQIGMSVQELALRSRVSVSYIYAIEAGSRGSHIDKLTRIAQALGMTIDELWKDSPS
ncbi:helix-turn-helix domain-containing protein [Ferroacidibacillus organovorans]|nr:helix-turn-helix transcriptional regulator [Ferroacidibacillus organovorans]